MSEVSVNNREGVVTAVHPEWYDPDNPETRPPIGVVLNILTRGGVQIKGCWREDCKYVAWAPMLKVPDWAKQRISDYYGGKMR